MNDNRDTYAYVANINHRIKAVAMMLGISESSLRSLLADSKIEVRRANQDNPNSPAIRLFDLPTIFQIADYRKTKKQTKQTEGKKPIVIAVEIIKGGTGKTTTAAEVVVQLQLQGLKVLGIDIDIQANFTQLMGYEADLTNDEAVAYELSEKAIVNGTFATLCKPILERNAPKIGAGNILKYPFGPYGPAIIPADTFFSDLEHDISNTTGKRELVFKRFLNESLNGKVPGLNVGDFDVVVFDCPPSISFVATNAIACADIIIAPVRMESFSVKGLSRLVGEIHTIKAEYGEEVNSPELIILPTYYSNNLPRIGRMQEKLSQYRANMSPIVIGQSEEFPKSTNNYMPLSVVKPSCQAVEEYRRFSDFLAKKILEVSGSSKTPKNRTLL